MLLIIVITIDKKILEENFSSQYFIHFSSFNNKGVEKVNVFAMINEFERY
jgi:hypothetical protein